VDDHGVAQDVARLAVSDRPELGFHAQLGLALGVGNEIADVAMVERGVPPLPVVLRGRIPVAPSGRRVGGGAVSLVMQMNRVLARPFWVKVTFPVTVEPLRDSRSATAFAPLANAAPGATSTSVMAIPPITIVFIVIVIASKMRTFT
jgi:hypothetical protein